VRLGPPPRGDQKEWTATLAVGSPARHVCEGYPRLEELGLVGDGATAALVGQDGAVWWLCVPRFDSPPLFAALLDARRGGAFRVAPAGVRRGSQRYEDDTGIVVTELHSDEGVVRLTDLLTLRRGADLEEEARADRGELLRVVDVLDGPVTLEYEIEPRGGADPERISGGLRLRCRREEHRRLDLRLGSSLALEGLRGSFRLEQGERHHFRLKWTGGSLHHPADGADALLAATREAWRTWLSAFRYDGPEAALVRRSAITLKLLDHFENGAILAAPTSSLPEMLGGERNWDYRFTWIRDAAFSVYALRRIGLGSEAWSLLAWVLAAIEPEQPPRVLYDLDAGLPMRETEDGELAGYCGSQPVRFGNAAAHQEQHDVFGEIVDCAYQWWQWGGDLDERLWRRLADLVESAGREWCEPDRGIWEVRSPSRPFTYSAALCHVALDRGARLAEGLGRRKEAERWRREAGEIRDAILERAWDPQREALTENLGGGGLDASVLALPLRRVLAADHPRMVATARAVAEELGAGGGLLYRYLPDDCPDGLPGHEGAFLLCSFWYVDNLAGQGRLDEACELYESLCRRASPLGLLSEQIDPSDGSFLGNFPQAFSHVGVISSGVDLARHLGTAAASEELRRDGRDGARRALRGR
jgi:GH15 family glucan-1,4-alpha-glucosidase